MELLKQEPQGVGMPRSIEGARQAPGGVRIRCPRCGWEPGPNDRWMCTCGHVWNTFDTGAVCPACSHAWTQTQCLRCAGWSRHGDWYVEEPRA